MKLTIATCSEKSQKFPTIIEISGKQSYMKKKTLKEYGIKEYDKSFSRIWVLKCVGDHQNFKHSEMQTGFNLAYWVYGPWNADGTKTAERDDKLVWFCVLLFG
ncbi:2192_t:CDS:2 [Entrophospora sp. SA101]|nr:2192_t:CDS:2 [Entrophospora sp. SA101]